MLYELRSYWIDPALADDYIAWIETKALPVLQGEFGFRVLGFWRVVANAGTVEEEPPNFVWLLSWQGREERDAAWAAVRAAESWRRAREGIPAYHRREGNYRFLEGIPRSPLQ